MATEEGIVTDVGTRMAWVKTTQSSACKHCTAKDSCQTQGKEMRVEAINLANARSGDRVVISFETSSLLKATFLLYVFPILWMIGGAVIGQNLAPRFQMDDSVLSALFAFGFLFAAVAFVKITGNKMARKSTYQPKIVRVIREGTTGVPAPAADAETSPPPS
jgi:sigma-E factor negative regulatory protein RseC